MHHEKCRHKQCREIFFLSEKNLPNFFLTISGVIGLQVQDELERTSPSRPARKKTVVDLVRWSQGAQNAEK